MPRAPNTPAANRSRNCGRLNTFSTPTDEAPATRAFTTHSHSPASRRSPTSDTKTSPSNPCGYTHAVSSTRKAGNPTDHHNRTHTSANAGSADIAGNNPDTKRDDTENLSMPPPCRTPSGRRRGTGPTHNSPARNTSPTGNHPARPNPQLHTPHQKSSRPQSERTQQHHTRAPQQRYTTNPPPDLRPTATLTPQTNPTASHQTPRQSFRTPPTKLHTATSQRTTRPTAPQNPHAQQSHQTPTRTTPTTDPTPPDRHTRATNTRRRSATSTHQIEGKGTPS